MLKEKHPGGRPSAIPNTDKGLTEFEAKTQAFLEDLEETGTPFSVSKWAKYLGVSRPTLYGYLKRGEAWKKVLEGVQ